MESQSLSSPAGLRDLPVQLHRSRADSQRNQTNGLRPFRSLAEELGTRPKLPDSRTVVVTRSNDRWISLKSRLTILCTSAKGMDTSNLGVHAPRLSKWDDTDMKMCSRTSFETAGKGLVCHSDVQSIVTMFASWWKLYVRRDRSDVFFWTFNHF